MAAAPCSQEPTEAASYGVRPAASSAPISPVRTSPAPAVASHGTPVVVTRTSPAGVATSVRRPLSSTTASCGAGGLAGVVERAGLDVVAVGAHHGGELAGVRGEHGGDAQRPRGVGQRVGVDHDRDPVGDGRGQRLAGRVAAAGADRPGLDPALADHLGVRLPDPVGDGRVADVPDHAARGRWTAPATQSSPAPG